MDSGYFAKPNTGKIYPKESGNMRNRYSFLIIAITVSLMFTTTSFGQDTTQSVLQQRIESIIGDNVENYMQPFATGLGTAINTGLYHTAKIH